MLKRHRLNRLCCRAMCTGERPGAVSRRVAQTKDLVPDTTNAVQQYLEASLLLSWAQVSWLRRDIGGEFLPLVTKIDPASDYLTITISDIDHIGPMLGRVLPISSGGTVVGIPGLRTVLDRHHVELRLLSPKGQQRARVRLLGATRQQFKDALDGFADRYPGQRPLWRVRGVDQSELPMFEGHGTRLNSVTPLSFVLRRIFLWRSARRLTMLVGSA